VVMFHVEVFRAVMPCSFVVGYKRSRVKMEATWTSETLVS
jgi:hypothetical protein